MSIRLRLFRIMVADTLPLAQDATVEPNYYRTPLDLGNRRRDNCVAIPSIRVNGDDGSWRWRTPTTNGSYMATV
jgi:hypothetical protein